MVELCYLLLHGGEFSFGGYSIEVVGGVCGFVAWDWLGALVLGIVNVDYMV